MKKIKLSQFAKEHHFVQESTEKEGTGQKQRNFLRN
jgi:hypothetical protein